MGLRGTEHLNQIVQIKQISFTGVVQNANGTATLTGVSNVLFLSPYTETAGLVKSHAGGVTFVISNTSGFYNGFANKEDDETIDGSWNFVQKTTFNAGADMGSAIVSHVADPVANLDAANKEYVDNVVVAGAPNANETTKGIIQLATNAQMGTATSVGSTGARLIPPNDQLVKVSAGAGDVNKIAVLSANGTFDSSFFPLPLILTADQLQITTDPNSGDDAVRMSYADSLYVNILGTGSDGDVTLGGDISLSRDMYYNNLTMPAAWNINTAGYRIFVKGTLTRSGTGKIFNNGGAGGNGSGLTAGAAGSAAPGITVPPGVVGSIGAAGVGVSPVGDVKTDGNPGIIGASQTAALDSPNGVPGGAGGGGTTTAQTVAGGIAGIGGTTTRSVDLPFNVIKAYSLQQLITGSIVLQKPCAGSGSGGSGGAAGDAGAGSVQSGAGGGSGATGGIVWVAARFIVDTGSGTMFQAIGGVGGNGGNAVGGNDLLRAGGGGAGAGGGNGGSIIRLYKSLTGSAPTDVTGGAAGSGGSKIGTNGIAGAAGTAGSAGVVFDLVF